MGGCDTLSETSGEYLMLCQHARNTKVIPSSVLFQAGARSGKSSFAAGLGGDFISLCVGSIEQRCLLGFGVIGRLAASLTFTNMMRSSGEDKVGGWTAV